MLSKVILIPHLIDVDDSHKQRIAPSEHCLAVVLTDKSSEIKRCTRNDQNVHCCVEYDIRCAAHNESPKRRIPMPASISPEQARVLRQIDQPDGKPVPYRIGMALHHKCRTDADQEVTPE